MPQHTASVSTLSLRSMFFLLVLSLSAAFAAAQNLAFTPGIVTAYAGDTTGELPASAVTYTGPLSGLVVKDPTAMAVGQERRESVRL